MVKCCRHTLRRAIGLISYEKTSTILNGFTEIKERSKERREMQFPVLNPTHSVVIMNFVDQTYKHVDFLL